MKAVIEVEFTIDGPLKFSNEDIQKALRQNLQVNGPPLVARTLQGELVIRIEDLTLIERKED